MDGSEGGTSVRRVKLGTTASAVMAVVAVLLVLGAGLAVGGCSLGSVKEKVGSAVAKVLGKEGEEGAGAGATTVTDGGMTTDTGSESDGGSDETVVTVDDADTHMEVGSGAELPDGFPAGLIPADAEIMNSMTMEQDEMIMKSVSFSSGQGIDAMYEWFLAALPQAGFPIEHKMQFDSAGGRGFTIMGKNGSLELVATGSGEGDGRIYTVALTER